MNSIKDLTPRQLRLAADIQEKIITLQLELDHMLETGAPPTFRERGRKGRRMSAQGLANIRAGARRRWARVRAENGAGVGRRHKMSAAGRARIAARLRERWAAAKRAGRNAL